MDIALDALELSKNIRENIYRQIAAILHMGNVKFEDDDMGFAVVSEESKQSIYSAARLLSVDSEQLINAFLIRTLDKNTLYVTYITIHYNSLTIISILTYYYFPLPCTAQKWINALQRELETLQ